ncbi:MAG: hypothetical protein D6694_09175 [Gammaproteobacteria bacterium]|nr:MAG: hypothetical protein D6694_09175 [Gammaproteobacteria bacterium]
MERYSIAINPLIFQPGDIVTPDHFRVALGAFYNEAVGQQVEALYKRGDQEALRLMLQKIIHSGYARLVQPCHGMAHWGEIIAQATGFYFMGEPGSGKTSAMLSLLSAMPRMMRSEEMPYITIVDWHNEPGKWQGLPVIEDYHETVRWMKWMRDVELERRKRDLRKGIKHPWLFWVVDEIGALKRTFTRQSARLKQEAQIAGASRDQAQKAELLREAFDLENLLGDFLETLGSEGRKYNIIGIAANQVASTKGNGVEGMGDVLESYVKVYLGRLALKWADIEGASQEQRRWLAATAYPCYISKFGPALHRSHWPYEKRERGQPPVNVFQIQARPVPFERSPSVVPAQQFEQELLEFTLRSRRPVAIAPAESEAPRGDRDLAKDLQTLQDLLQENPNASQTAKLKALGYPASGAKFYEGKEYLKQLEIEL